jgi:hypothetical protein
VLLYSYLVQQTDQYMKVNDHHLKKNLKKKDRIRKSGKLQQLQNAYQAEFRIL